MKAGAGAGLAAGLPSENVVPPPHDGGMESREVLRGLVEAVCACA